MLDLLEAGSRAGMTDSRMRIHVIIIQNQQARLERLALEQAIILAKARYETEVGARIQFIFQAQPII